MAAVETTALLSAARHARRKECGRLDRGHSGVLARVRSGRRSLTASPYPILVAVSSPYFLLFHHITTPLNACRTTSRLEADITIRDGVPNTSPVWIWRFISEARTASGAVREF